ncbi:MAG TPA: LysR family transcriptional regulator [Kofleriaceae bacterium]|nr:LysR family transcriptional regulator [Kofleriaceae bacterium]
MDRLDEWRVFVEVANRQSFAATARALRRSPQAITRAIAALEQRIGTRLLHRTTRSVSLTDDGIGYLERARRAVAELDALEQPAAVVPRGTVAITAPILFGQLHVVPLAAELLAAHAAIDLRLVLADRVLPLADESLDLGVRIGALPDSALRARLVGHVRSVIVASPGYLARAGTPRKPETLAHHAAIAFTATTPIANRWAFRDPGRARGRSVAVHPRLVVDTGQAAIDAALLGVGLVRVFSYQVDALVAAKRLRIVLRDHEGPPVPVHLVQLAGIPTRSATLVADFLAPRLARRLGAAST